MAIISNGNTIIDAGAIDANEVNTTQIVNSAVNNDKIAAATIALAKLSASGSPSASTFLRGDNTWAAAGGGVNTPAFLVRRISNQSFSAFAYVKVQLNSELFDTAGAFDSSTNYRFTVPAGQGGKYVFSLTSTIYSASNDVASNETSLYKNGSQYVNSACSVSGGSTRFSNFNNSYTYIDTANAGDYYEMYVRTAATSPQIATNATHFSGFKIIE